MARGIVSSFFKINFFSFKWAIQNSKHQAFFLWCSGTGKIFFLFSKSLLFCLCWEPSDIRLHSSQHYLKLCSGDCLVGNHFFQNIKILEVLHFNISGINDIYSATLLFIHCKTIHFCPTNCINTELPMVLISTRQAVPFIPVIKMESNFTFFVCGIVAFLAIYAGISRQTQQAKFSNRLKNVGVG